MSSHVSYISSWYVLHVLGRQSVDPVGGSRLQLMSRPFAFTRPYVETLLPREIDTQVSPSCTIYGLAHVTVGGSGADVTLTA